MRTLKAFLYFIAILCNFMLSAEKVYIFTYSYNRPDFIEIQYKTFKKFLLDDYEFIVFNDARETPMRTLIEQKCASLGITCINIPQSIHSQPYLQRLPGEDPHNPSVRNCNVVQYSLNNLGFFHHGIVALFDSDLFLVKEFSIKEYLKGCALAGVHQGSPVNGKVIEYLWIGLVFLDFSRMPNKETINFNCGRIDGAQVDAGGYTHCYLRDNPDAKVKFLSQMLWPFSPCIQCQEASVPVCTHNTEELIAAGFDEHQIAFIRSGPINCEFMHNQTFFHYRGGTNWNGQSPEYHQRKTKALNDYINGILGM